MKSQGVSRAILVVKQGITPMAKQVSKQQQHAMDFR